MTTQTSKRKKGKALKTASFDCLRDFLYYARPFDNQRLNLTSTVVTVTGFAVRSKQLLAHSNFLCPVRVKQSNPESDLYCPLGAFTNTPVVIDVTKRSYNDILGLLNADGNILKRHSNHFFVYRGNVFTYPEMEPVMLISASHVKKDMLTGKSEVRIVIDHDASQKLFKCFTQMIIRGVATYRKKTRSKVAKTTKITCVSMRGDVFDAYQNTGVDLYNDLWPITFRPRFELTLSGDTNVVEHTFYAPGTVSEFLSTL